MAQAPFAYIRMARLPQPGAMHYFWIRARSRVCRISWRAHLGTFLGKVRLQSCQPFVRLHMWEALTMSSRHRRRAPVYASLHTDLMPNISSEGSQARHLVRRAKSIFKLRGNSIQTANGQTLAP